MCYLRFQATSRPCPVSVIPEVDVYKFDPWELPDKLAEFEKNEWYFFTSRDRKYPNGVRPNRAAVSGYWKATGTDKAIHSGSKTVGIKKALVYYKGKPPKGIKTDWIMHEYRMSEPKSQPYKPNDSMRLDDWVLCRIYKKKNLGRANCTISPHDARAIEAPHHIMPTTIISGDEPQQYYNKLPRISSLTHLWEFDYMGLISHLLDESSCNSNQEAPKIQPFTDQQSYVNPMYGMQSEVNQSWSKAAKERLTEWQCNIGASVN